MYHGHVPYKQRLREEAQRIYTAVRIDAIACKHATFGVGGQAVAKVTKGCYEFGVVWEAKFVDQSLPRGAVHHRVGDIDPPQHARFGAFVARAVLPHEDVEMIHRSRFALDQPRLDQHRAQLSKVFLVSLGRREGRSLRGKIRERMLLWYAISWDGVALEYERPIDQAPIPGGANKTFTFGCCGSHFFHRSATVDLLVRGNELLHVQCTSTFTSGVAIRLVYRSKDSSDVVRSDIDPEHLNDTCKFVEIQFPIAVFVQSGEEIR